ncbi:MAG: HPF/RaiA family ribosome-associated protein [Planctomycetes bacterium]|nr:HPF/RaiA family ribosome-associated protein [Planctomycetota bacterium]
MVAHLNLSDATLHEGRLSLHAHGLNLTESLQDSVWQSLTSALNQFSRRIHTIHVCLEDVNGPRGGVDTRCRINIHLLPHSHISVSAIASDLFVAVSKASTRARELVHRRIKKVQARRRQLTRQSIHVL